MRTGTPLMIDKRFFVDQIGRLALIFDPGRYDGDTGKAQLREMYPFFKNGHPDDLKVAVDSVIESFNDRYGKFPGVSLIKGHIYAAARNRRDNTPRLPQPESTISREQVAEIIREAGFKSIMDKANA